MSVSSVAGAYGPRNWTPIQNRRDDAAQQTAASNTSSPDEGSTPTTPFANLRSPTDSIQVSLPNGMSVGMFHFGAGSSGFDAQMLQSLEDLVSNLSAYTPTSKGTADGTQAGAVSDGSKNTGSNGDMQGMQAIDMIHVDLPNGISIEVRHGSATGDADGGLAAMKEMETEMEELVGHFSNLGNGSTDSTSTSASAAANQHRLAAYAEQAKQTYQTSLAAGLGLSR
jgi:hypothetical protein